ncbi:hypothetical protein [Variovorax paradoxus]|jgi:hypothetical protein|uniref:hypothetical protein n=1 Tax=Variovorax paradoxus TaxID=34073 RepID=UPI003ECDC311
MHPETELVNTMMHAGVEAVINPKICPSSGRKSTTRLLSRGLTKHPRKQALVEFVL